MTDTQFLFDYQLSQFIGQFDPFHTGVATEGVSQVYLSGAGDRSYFDIRSIYYYGFSGADNQSQIPVIHPVLDYSNVLAQPIMGGELSYKFNLTSLTRQNAEFDAINANAANNNLCATNNPADRQLFELPAARHCRHLLPLVRRSRLAAHLRYRATAR